MKTLTNDPFKRPSKTQLIWFWSLIITIILSVPRLLLMISEIQLPHQLLLDPIDWSLPFFLRIVFNFLFCLLFLTLNLQDGIISLASFKKIDLSRFSHRLAVNLLVFASANAIIVSVHLYLAGPHILQHVFIKACTLINLLILSVILILSQMYRQLFKNQQLLLANESLKRKNAESQFEVLKSQVNPYFLFNSFNTLRGIIQTKPTAAIDFVNNMSDVFRYSLENTKENVVRISDEIQFVSAYLEIIRERFGAKIKITLVIDEVCNRFYIPPLALQILAENAIKHNVISEQEPLHIFIHNVGESYITVCNHLQERKEREPSMEMGLYNLNERYKYISGKEISVKRTKNEFIVALPLLTHEIANR